VALRDSMRDSAAQYLAPGEPIQAVIGAQTASAWLAALTGALVFLGLNRYRIIAVTPTRIVVLDAGKTSMKKARGVVTELPRSTRLGPGSGVWHQIPAGSETLRVHRRFFKDLQTADAALAAA
jgi:cytosine/adenosine deaminase-related metal-dependent hydrolase